MSPITRSWLGMAALGTGITHIALGAGAPLPLAAPLILVGATEIAWGVAAVVRDRLPLVAPALVLFLLPLFGWALLITAAAVGGRPDFLAALPFLPMATAALMGLFLSAMLAVHLRRRASTTSDDDPVPSPSAGRYLLGVLAGGLLVSGLTTPALASTSAGLEAVPHGTHGSSSSIDEHGGH
ncbi:hypothetical protein [Planctomonas psychrotolerans]|uniref:hypothetical protein n=1 Tax=Planctomonas psychrotolerans TaxID=2528712 RepID=UPI00123BA899|nr:hypothetical protein [Planctomonas psychrotolerans]